MKATDSVSLPDKDIMMPKDESLSEAELEDEDLDDSKVPTKTVIVMMVDEKLPKGIATRQSSSLMSNWAAESLENIDELVVGGELGTSSGGTSVATVGEMGPGRWKQKPNTWYHEFWQHNNDDNSDVKAEEWLTWQQGEHLFHSS